MNFRAQMHTSLVSDIPFVNRDITLGNLRELIK